MSQNHSPSTTLLVKAPQGGIKEIEVSHTPFTIGRKSDNDLCLVERFRLDSGSISSLYRW